MNKIQDFVMLSHSMAQKLFNILVNHGVLSPGVCRQVAAVSAASRVIFTAETLTNRSCQIVLNTEYMQCLRCEFIELFRIDNSANEH